MAKTCEIHFKAVLPWWMNIYMMAVYVRCRLFGVAPDTDKMADTIVRHTKFLTATK